MDDIRALQAGLLKDPAKSPWLLFAISFTGSLVLFLAILKAILILQAEGELSELKVRQAARLAVAGGIIERSADLVASDLMALAATPSVRALTEQDSPASRAGVAELFRAFAREKRLYSQLRYLDADGKEIVRIEYRNGLVVQVPDRELQSKGHRYYFREAITLGEGGLYLSPMDLNVEHGVVEEPFSPVMRLATPVFSQSGERRGVVLLNLFGESILSRYREAMGTETPFMLLNSSGDLLVAPDRGQEWGFMFGEPGRFIRQYPNVWKRLESEHSGSWLVDSGLFCFDTVTPLQAEPDGDGTASYPFVPGNSEIRGRESFWKIVALVPPEQLPSAAITGNRVALMVALAGIVLLMAANAAGVQLLSGRRRLRQQALERGLRYKVITDNLAEGLLVMDSNGFVIELNPEAERLLGWKREELIGQPAHSRIHSHPEHATSEEECPILRAMKSATPYQSDGEAFVKKDGTWFWVSVNAAPLTIGDSVDGMVLAFRDITLLREQQQQIRHLAYHDSLTGLPNRRLLMGRLEVAVAQVQRHRRTLALMFIDLDHFKQVNDTYGHEGGDILLKAVASRLGMVVRDGDTVSRQGGDEFLVLLPEIESAERARMVAERILKVLREPVPFYGNLIPVSVSIGIAFCPDDAETVDELVRNADAAMYKAKQAGRNAYCLCGRGVEWVASTHD